MGFEIEAAPPGGDGGAYASSTTVQLELPVPGSSLAEDEARLRNRSGGNGTELRPIWDQLRERFPS